MAGDPANTTQVPQAAQDRSARVVLTLMEARKGSPERPPPCQLKHRPLASSKTSPAAAPAHRRAQTPPDGRVRSGKRGEVRRLLKQPSLGMPVVARCASHRQPSHREPAPESQVRQEGRRRLDRCLSTPSATHLRRQNAPEHHRHRHRRSAGRAARKEAPPACEHIPRNTPRSVASCRTHTTRTGTRPNHAYVRA